MKTNCLLSFIVGMLCMVMIESFIFDFAYITRSDLNNIRRESHLNNEELAAYKVYYNGVEQMLDEINMPESFYRENIHGCYYLQTKWVVDSLNNSKLTAVQ